MRAARIVAPHFVAGVVIGRVAAPIVNYMRVWREASLVAYCKRKGWSVVVFNIPGQPISVRVAAVFDGNQWDAPNRFRRTLGMVDVIVYERPVLGQIVEGRLADEYDPDSYRARAVACGETFGDEAYLVIGERE